MGISFVREWLPQKGVNRCFRPGRNSLDVTVWLRTGHPLEHGVQVGGREPEGPLGDRGVDDERVDELVPGGPQLAQRRREQPGGPEQRVRDGGQPRLRGACHDGEPVRELPYGQRRVRRYQPPLPPRPPGGGPRDQRRPRGAPRGPTVRPAPRRPQGSPPPPPAPPRPPAAETGTGP